MWYNNSTPPRPSSDLEITNSSQHQLEICKFKASGQTWMNCINTETIGMAVVLIMQLF